MPPTLMWFRNDLRLADNPALALAMRDGGPVLCVAVEPRAEHERTAESASARWRAASLRVLAAELLARGGALAVLGGPPERVLPTLACELGATRVCCSRDHAPDAMAAEAGVRDALAEAGVALDACEGQLLAPPARLRTAGGGEFRVFGAFFRAWERAVAPDRPLDAPTHVPAPPGWAERTEAAARPTARRLGSGAHTAATTAGGAAVPPLVPGEPAALERLAQFAAGALAAYGVAHDLPALDGTSALSPHLACGALSPRQIAWAATNAADADIARPFLRQLAWREFAYHTLAAFPALAEKPWRAEFSAVTWLDDPSGLAAWREGRTGFPLVDAGMRQLATTGWMHNRVRMVAASLLAKDLLVPWQIGEQYFRDTLADFDPAANAFNWQWVAGSGADAAPYFRVFNPAVQGKRFDAEGEYVRRWVPELAQLPGRWIHAPHLAPAGALEAAGIVLGRSYPLPIVDHAMARRRALAVFSAARKTPRGSD